MAVRVAAVAGTVGFALNHGTALVKGRMTRDRRISSRLTYPAPGGRQPERPVDRPPPIAIGFRK